MIDDNRYDRSLWSIEPSRPDKRANAATLRRSSSDHQSPTAEEVGHHPAAKPADLGLPELPFGGVKGSGSGSGDGTDALKGYLNAKFVSVGS